jgi:hypothetical protein
MGAALLPESAAEPRQPGHAAVASHLYPDLANPEGVAVPQEVGSATGHHVVFTITVYEIDTSISSQTPFDPDRPQALSAMGTITGERKVLMVSPPSDHCRRAGGTGVMILGRGAPCCYRSRSGRYPGLLAAR